MRAIVIDHTGGPEVFRLADVPVPEPGPGEILIRVACAGVNPADWKCREGYLAGFMNPTFPFVIGFDLAGTVAAVGPGAEGFIPGTRVFAQTDVGAGKWGSYAEYATVRQDSVVRMPDRLTFAEAAAVPTPALAAWTALFDDGGLSTGQKVLIHGGAGAVGSFAIQFARIAGAKVASTCGTYNMNYVRTLGCDLAIDYRTTNILDAVRAWTPEGLQLVFDTVGCATLPGALDMLRRDGILVAILTLETADTGPDHAMAAQRSLRTAVAFSKMPSGEPLGKIAALLARAEVQPPRIEVLPLAQVVRAHDLLQSGQARTKLVLQVADLE